MIHRYPYSELGRANHGWLDARHHFSFAHYYNPERMSFGVLRVINDDIISAGTGFDTHPHQDMEIITYVRSGAITHKDSHGGVGRTEAGDVQVMSAGTGIYHSEFNREDKATTLYQIWIEPNKKRVKPQWDCHQFPTKEVDTQLSLLVSGDGKAPLQIHQDAFIYAGKLAAGKSIQHKIKHQAYILISAGSVKVDDKKAFKGDGVEVTEQKSVNIHALEAAEVLVLDIPEN